MPLAPTTHSTRLENGLRVLSEPIPHTSSAAISVLVQAGPADEADRESGLAHLCEHSLFLGTPQRNSGELARMIDTAGGCFGAFTAPEYTCLYAHLMKDYVSYGFDLLGDVLVASSVPEVGLAQEKEVICQEIRGHLGDACDVVLQQTKQLLWPGHSLSRSVTGTEADVRSLERDDVLEFIRAHYTPDRIIVAATGAVDHQSIVEQAQDAFWTLESAAANETAPQETIPVERGGFQVCQLPIKQCSFSVAIPAIAYSDPRRYAMFVMSNLIGGGMSSRLYQELRKANGLLYSIQSHLLSYRQDGALVISGVTSPENLNASVQAALNQLAGIALGALPIDEEELWKSKMQVRSQSRLASDMISSRVSTIATQELHFGRRLHSDEITRGIDAVTIDDLQAVASSVLLPNLKHLAMVVAGPVGSDHDDRSELNDIFNSYRSLGE